MKDWIYIEVDFGDGKVVRVYKNQLDDMLEVAEATLNLQKLLEVVKDLRG